jgi:5'-nucleotidase / UDP-sugar diphosphatase
VVDTGGTILGSSQGPVQTDDGLIVRALSMLHYDALNAGTGELLAGPTALKELASGSPAVVSANGSFAAKEAPNGVLKPYVVKSVAGKRVALVGVTDGGTAADGSVATTKAPLDALRAIMPEVRSKADVVVVLADSDASSVKAIADAGLGGDVLLGARSTTGQEPVLVGKTLVANAGGLDRYVDRLTMTVAPDGHVTAFEHEEVPLDESVKEDQAITQLRASYAG